MTRTYSSAVVDRGRDPTLDDLEWHGMPRDEFLALCAELGFDRIRECIHRWTA